MLRVTIACVLFALLVAAPAPGRGEPSPTPTPAEAGGDGSFTAEDFKALTEPRVERVLAAFPKMQTWLKKVDRESQKLQQSVERDGALALPAAMRFSQDTVSAEKFAKEVGMPMDEFYRDWGMVTAVHAVLLADEAHAVGKKQLEAGLASPELPEAAKVAVREQLALMEKRYDETATKVPDAVKELISARRKRIETLLETHEKHAPEENPEGPEPAPTPADQ